MHAPSLPSIFLALAVVASLAALPQGIALPGTDAAAEIQVAYSFTSGTAITTPSGFSCILGGVPAPEVEVRCTPTTAATKCGDPSAKGAVMGSLASLTVRSICTAGTQASCTASTPATSGFWTVPVLSQECLGTTTGAAGVPFVCHVVPGGGLLLAYEATCQAFVG